MAKKSQKLILVTGATGKQGGSVFRRLLQKNSFSIRVLTRQPEKPEARALVGKGVDVVQGDLSDVASLTRALEDVDGVFSVQDSAQGGEAETKQGINLVDAANRSGVKHLVYSSVGSADKKTGIPHFESKAAVERHIQGSGIAYTILRPVFFMENWLGNREQIEQGVLTTPLKAETRLQMIAVEDIGAFALEAFEHPGKWSGKALDIAGDELSLAEIAKAFSTAEGRDVRYQQRPWDQFEKLAGNDMTLMFRWFEEVGYHVDIAALREEHTNLTNFERWLNEKWQSAASEQEKKASA